MFSEWNGHTYNTTSLGSQGHLQRTLRACSTTSSWQRRYPNHTVEALDVFMFVTQYGEAASPTSFLTKWPHICIDTAAERTANTVVQEAAKRAMDRGSVALWLDCGRAHRNWHSGQRWFPAIDRTSGARLRVETLSTAQDPEGETVTRRR